MTAKKKVRLGADGRPLDPRDRISPADLERIRRSVDAAPKFTPEQIAALRAIAFADAAPIRVEHKKSA